MVETVVVMPYDYDDNIDIDVSGYKAQSKLTKLFTKYYQEKAQIGREECIFRQNKRKFSIYEANVEEYYGEVLEEIERSPTDILYKILENENPIKEMYNKLNLPTINYKTGKKTLRKN